MSISPYSNAVYPHMEPVPTNTDAEVAQLIDDAGDMPAQVRAMAANIQGPVERGPLVFPDGIPGQAPPTQPEPQAPPPPPVKLTAMPNTVVELQPKARFALFRAGHNEPKEPKTFGRSGNEIDEPKTPKTFGRSKPAEEPAAPTAPEIPAASAAPEAPAPVVAEEETAVVVDEKTEPTEDSSASLSCSHAHEHDDDRSYLETLLESLGISNEEFAEMIAEKVAEKLSDDDDSSDTNKRSSHSHNH